MGSALTGLIFVVIVTSNLPPLQWGLWQLVSKVISYVLIPTAIINFWITRYRARGRDVGWTSVVAVLIFTAVLASLFVIVSIPLASDFPTASPANTNFFFFLLSTPQILLYTLAGALESLLWGVSPEKASYGFASFEVAKIVVAFVGVSIFHLSLEGAVLAVIAAQIVQILVLISFSRHDFKARPSFEVIGAMVRAGWLAILDLLDTFVITLDFLVVSLITGSLLPIALYGAAAIIGNVVTYSGSVASGLYASVLSGKDASKSTNQVFELQIILLIPLTLGTIILSKQLLNLLNPEYDIGATILVILVIGYAFFSIQSVEDSVISGADTTDSNLHATASSYLRGSLFWLSKINLLFASLYLVGVALIARSLGMLSGSGYLGQYELMGEVWAMLALGIFATGFVSKARYMRKFARLSIDSKVAFSILISSVVYAAILFTLAYVVFPNLPNGEIPQAVRLVAIGVSSICFYFATMYGISSSFRKITKVIMKDVLGKSQV
jgi:O-antigen/teichoic acid export membrane protein